MYFRARLANRLVLTGLDRFDKTEKKRCDAMRCGRQNEGIKMIRREPTIN